MNIIGEKVKHVSMGEGVVKKCDDQYITIEINNDEKSFKFPYCFERYFTFLNSKLQNSINDLIQERKKEDGQRAEEERVLRAQKLAEEIEKARTPKSRRTKKAKKLPNSNNIAFKCTYCDGGSSNEHVGFNGVCSDKIIKYNIKKKKQIWCSEEECPCFQYYNQQISRKELDDTLKNDGFVCYESVMMKNWEARGGERRNGNKKGQAFAIKNAKENGLVVLTTRLPNESEIDRSIFAVYIIKEVFEGDDYNDSIITAHDKYRIELTNEEAKKMPYWKYYHNGNSSNRAFWGAGLFRYISNNSAYHILNDIIDLKANQADKELIKEMLEYFCKKNNVVESKIVDVEGLLK